MYRWFNDAEVTEFLSMRYPLSHAQKKEFVDRTSTISYGMASFAVETLAEGKLIGGGDLRTGPPRSSARRAWNRGGGQDHVGERLRHGRHADAVPRRVPRDEPSPDRAVGPGGERDEGVRREAVFKGGRYHDMVLMSVLEGELAHGWRGAPGCW